MCGLRQVNTKFVCAGEFTCFGEKPGYNHYSHMVFVRSTQGLSVRKTAHIAAAFARDGVRGRSITQLAASGRERDFFRWVRSPVEPYNTEVPILATVGLDKKIVTAEVGFVLPSDMLAAMYCKGEEVMRQCILGADGAAGIASYWAKEDPSFLRELDLSHDEALHTIPMGFHVDGVPKWHDESASFWSWMTPMTTASSLVTRHCVVGISTSKVCVATRRAVLDIIAWDLQSLRTGVWPVADHLGREFAAGSSRARRAGTRIAGPWTACFAFWKGDQEAAVDEHLIKNHYRCNFVCDFCYASKVHMYLSYGDLTESPNWLDTMCVDDADPSPWRKVAGYSRRRRLWDGALNAQYKKYRQTRWVSARCAQKDSLALSEP